MAGTLADGKRGGKRARARSRTLYQITILVIAVYILAGLVMFFLYARSQDRLLSKSRDKLIEMQVTNVAANSSFIIDYLVYLGQDELSGLDEAALLAVSSRAELTPGQAFLSEKLAEMTGAGFMGLAEALLFLPPAGARSQALIVAASGGDPVYALAVPEDLQGVPGEGIDYVWVEEGLPDLGVKGLSLVVRKTVAVPGTDLRLGYLAIKPMAEDVAAIDAFYDEKKSDGLGGIGLLITISIVAMSLLTLLFIALIVRWRITRPIDRLSAAAGDALDGDLEARVPVRRGDEFEGLERAVNTLLGNLNAMFSMSLAGTAAGRSGEEQGRAARRGEEVLRPARPYTLYFITAFLVVMFLVFGLVTFSIFSGWQNGLIDEGRERMIEGISRYFVSASHYIRDTLDPVIAEKMLEGGFGDIPLEEQYGMLLRGEMTDYQRFYNQFSEQLVELGALGMERVMVVLAGMGIPDGATVVVCDDESLVYNWEVPDYLLKAIDVGTPYLYMKDGIEELGFEGEYIVAIELFKISGLTQAYIGAKPIRAEVAELRGFYDKEKRDLYAVLVPFMAAVFVAFILLTFLVVGYLIRRNITRPVEELSAAAGQVMRGDLDVKITVNEGDDISQLQRAMAEIVESLRRLISRSTEEG